MTGQTITAEGLSLGKQLNRLFKYKSLIITFAVRDLKIQYAQTFLGIIWGLFRPLSGLLIYSMFFGYILNVDSNGIPYPLFAFSGMVCWYSFSGIISQVGRSLLESQNIIKKIYFPKLILPLSKILVALVDLLLTVIILAGIMLFYGFPISLNLVLFPFVLIANLMVALSIGIWLSVLTVRFRDFHQIIPYLVNFGIFVTPVFYPSTLIPGKYHFLLYCNPVAGVVEAMRWSLFGGTIPSSNYLYGFAASVAILLTGFYYFLKIESKIADTI